MKSARYVTAVIASVIAVAHATLGNFIMAYLNVGIVFLMIYLPRVTDDFYETCQKFNRKVDPSLYALGILTAALVCVFWPIKWWIYRK